MTMYLFRLVLGLLLVSSRVAAFVANVGNGRSAESLAIKPLSTPFAQDHATSLHVGVSYGPPGLVEGQNKNVFLPRQNRDVASALTLFEVDPAFHALSATYDIRDEQGELRRRKVTRAFAASTAVVCAMMMAKPLLSTATASIALFLSQLPHFYMAYPLKASVATCSLNSALADTISQFNKGGEYSWRQLASSLCYGSVCLGVGSNLVYTKLLPILLSGTSGLTTVMGSALMDNCVFAPLLWLPP